MRALSALAIRRPLTFILQVYKSSQLVIVSLRVCSGPQWWRLKHLCADDRVITYLCILGYIRACVFVTISLCVCSGPNKHDRFSPS